MNKEFKTHMLSHEGNVRANLIASLFDELLTRLESVCPSCREFSITRTKLEEACFYAKKAMAPEHCEKEIS
jgi:hypothetical protein